MPRGGVLFKENLLNYFGLRGALIQGVPVQGALIQGITVYMLYMFFISIPFLEGAKMMPTF